MATAIGPLSAPLQNGDEVQILTSKAQTAPPAAWEAIVVTGKARDAIRPGQWRERLGDVRYVRDWTVLFEAELADHGWRATLVRWWPRLLPGLSASATHGVIRTAHAVRSLRLPGAGIWQPMHHVGGGILHLLILAGCLFMLVKANRGEHYRLPIVGDLAERSVAEQRVG